MTDHTDPTDAALDLDVFETTLDSDELTREQRIRSDALGRAIELVVMSSNRLPGAVLDIAEKFAAWIRTGQRP